MYNNYNPNYSYSYGNQYQPPQPQQAQQQLNVYAFVDGIAGAQAYQVKPNTMMLLMDSQQPICYKKQVDGFGRTVVFEVYDLIPHQESKQEPQFVTREEFANEINGLKALLGKVEQNG